MSLLKKIGSKIKNSAAKIGNVANNVAKSLSQSKIPLLAAAGKLVDGVIDDDKVAAMSAAATRDGSVKVAEVEKTVQKAAAERGITDTAVINKVVHETATAIAEETKTTINDEGAEVKTTIKEKITAFVQKYKNYLLGGGAAAVVAFVAWFTTRKGGKNRYRR